MIRNGWGAGVGPGPHHFASGIAMGVLWLALIVIAVLLVIWLVKQSRLHHAAADGGNGTVAVTGETPLDIIQVRYARGDIDKAEFEQKKQDLST